MSARSVAGALVALAGVAGLTAAHGPPPGPPLDRHHRPGAGGARWWPGWPSAASGPAWWPWSLGFFAYDFLFIPPYYTLAVGAGRELGGPGRLRGGHAARGPGRVQPDRGPGGRPPAGGGRPAALRSLRAAHGDQPLSELLDTVVSRSTRPSGPMGGPALARRPGPRRRCPPGGGHRRAAVDRRGAGPGWPPPGAASRACRLARAEPGGPHRPTAGPSGCSPSPGPELDPFGWELLQTYANHAALALERSQLREQALRSELLEEVDRWRGALMGAVSHDLRTPLATMKAAVSTLRQGPRPDPADRRGAPGADRAADRSASIAWSPTCST